MTQRDEERIERISTALRGAGLRALVCTQPENVLLLTGYWPVVGTALAVALADGRAAILAPDDESDLAHGAWVHQVRTYAPGSLASLTGPAEAILEPLCELLRDLGVADGTIGYEDGPGYLGASYAAMYLAGTAAHGLLSQAAPGAAIVPGAPAIGTLRSSLTTQEVDRVRLACRIAGDAFNAMPQHMRPGRREPEVAQALATPIVTQGFASASVRRTQAFTWCMSGPNAALAGAAYARTRDRVLRRGDLVLVHCNSTVDGYWTDITRTYCLGEPDGRQQAMYDAIFAARSAALEMIHPGAQASEVDAAGRAVLAERGFGDYFTHGIGHNVGFSVISAEYPPRLHPASPDRLEAGMTFNLEPAIYIPDYGAIRHCDVVTVHAGGPEVLTAFQSDMESLIVQA